jgi:hypothetical protein
VGRPSRVIRREKKTKGISEATCATEVQMVEFVIVYELAEACLGLPATAGFVRCSNIPIPHHARNLHMAVAHGLTGPLYWQRFSPDAISID